MTKFQKIVKNIALVFAILLAVSIISTIVLTIIGVIGSIKVLDNSSNIIGDSNVNIMTDTKIYSIDEIESLKIDIGTAKLKIQKNNDDDNIKLELIKVSSKINLEVDDYTLKVKNNIENINFLDESEIIIHIPQNKIFKNVDIRTGVSDTNISYINTNKLEFKSGVGNTKIDEIVANTVNIKGGVGKIGILNCNTLKLKLEAGMGECIFNGEILEDASFNSGIGSLNINLMSKENNYRFRINTGIGNVLLNDKKCENDKTYNDGMIYVKISSGIGNIDITTK